MKRTLLTVACLCIAATTAACGDAASSVADIGGEGGVGGIGDPAAQCSTYEGPNPSVEQLQEMYGEVSDRSAALREQYKLPTISGAEDVAAAKAEQLRTVVASELQHTPPGAFQAYTEFACATGDVLAGGATVVGDRASIEAELDQATKNDPAYSNVDREGYIDDVLALGDEYTALAAVFPLSTTCAMNRSNGYTVAESEAAARLEGSDFRLAGARILCPDIAG